MKKSVALGVAGLAVVAVTGGVMATTTSFAATNRPAGTQSAAATASPATTASRAGATPTRTGAVDTPAGPLDLAGPKLHVTQNGAVVTVLQGKDEVATMTLSGARYTRSSAHALVTITSSRPVTLNTGQFKVFVDDGDSGLDDEKALTLPAGTHTVTIDASDIGSQPHGFGWDGGSDTINAQWLSA